MVLAAGEVDLDGALTDVEVSAGAWDVALGAGCGLLDALAAEFDFLPGAGVDGDLTPAAGVELARAGAAGAGEVSATVRTVDSVELAAGSAAVRAGAAAGIELG